MEYQKILNFFENTPDQLTKFKSKNSVEINDNSRGRYSTNSRIKFKTSALAASEGNNNIQVVFKKFAPFTNHISEINNIQIDNAKDINVVIPM